MAESGRKKIELATYFRDQKAYLLTNILFGSCECFLSILIALNMQKVMDHAIRQQNWKELFSSLLFFAVLIISSAFFTYVRSVVSGKIGANTMFRMRQDVFWNIENLTVSYVERKHSAEIFNGAVGDLCIVESFMNYKLSRVLYVPLAFVLSFVCLFYFQKHLLLLSLIITPVVITVSFLIVGSLGQLTHRLQEVVGGTNVILKDSISGMHIYKAYNLSEKMYSKYFEAIENVVSREMRIVLRIAFLSPLLYVFKLLPSIIAIIFGGYLIVQGDMSLGELLAFTYLLNILIGVMTEIPDLTGEIKKINGSLSHLNAIIPVSTDAISFSGERNSVTGHMAAFETSEDPVSDSMFAVRVKSIDFDYDGENSVFSGLSLDIKRGLFTAIVGPSGCGKSTLIKLICGFYPLKAGVLEICSTTLESGAENAKDYISFVSQDSYLFPVSIQENISYGKPESTIDEITDAAKKANAHNFITNLPEGYETLVGERGARLSGGEKQRIAIARAILKGSPIIVLDEPTSSLDNSSDEEIRKTLESLKGDRTILVVSHKLTTIRNADEIFVMNSGMIIDRGNHHELMERDGYYRKIYVKQCRFDKNKSWEEI